MKFYNSPTVVEIGSSSKLIQGSCGWGTENWTLDKTGYKKYGVRKDMGNGICYILPLCAASKPKDEC